MEKIDNFLIRLADWMTLKKFIVLLICCLMTGLAIGSYIGKKTDEKIRSLVREEVKAAITEEFEKRDAK